jgi:hypothetical protein
MNRTDHRQTRGPRRGLVHRGRRHREGGRLPARGGETAPHVRAGTDFMVVSSDAIYPAGDAEDYDAKFYGPYEDHPNPIYALPGNHDWFDGLVGFMHHLCGAEVSSLPATQGRPSSLKERLRRCCGADRRKGFRKGFRCAGARMRTIGWANARPTLLSTPARSSSWA